MVTRPQFDKAEKRFLAASLLLIALFFGALRWWGEVNTLPEIEIPAKALPALNAYDDFVQANVLLMPSPPRQAVDAMLDSKEVPKKDWPKVYPLWRKKVWLRQNAPALKAFRQGLRRVYVEPAPRSFSALFPHYARFREMARVISVESRVRAADGDWKGASQSALDTMQFGGQIPNGGPLIGALVGYTIQAMGRRQLQSLVPHLDAPTCRAAARRIEQIHAARVPFWQVLREEKWSGQGGLLDAMRQRDWANQLYASWGIGGGPPNIGDYLRYRFTSKRRILSDYTRYMDGIIASAKQPYATAPTVPLPDGFVGESLAPAYEHARFNDARAATGNLMLATALALRAYNLERGAFPEKLEQLVPNYLSQLPMDGFGRGEALRYKKQGDSFVLWSIGPDKKDNGGKAIQGTPRPSRAYDLYSDEVTVDVTSQGDWVYEKNR